MVVLDASGILNAFGFRYDRKFYTTPSVIDEIKDLRSRSIVDVGITDGNLIAMKPAEASVEFVRAKARELGLQKKLSKTDIEVLALAWEMKDEVWTDDKAMRRLATKLGIKTEPIIWK